MLRVLLLAAYVAAAGTMASALGPTVATPSCAHDGDDCDHCKDCSSQCPSCVTCGGQRLLSVTAASTLVLHPIADRLVIPPVSDPAPLLLGARIFEPPRA